LNRARCRCTCCCIYLLTQEDVFELDSEGNPVYLPLDDIDMVLNEIETGDYIFEQVFECIDDEIRAGLKSQRNLAHLKASLNSHCAACETGTLNVRWPQNVVF